MKRPGNLGIAKMLEVAFRSTNEIQAKNVSATATSGALTQQVAPVDIYRPLWLRESEAQMLAESTTVAFHADAQGGDFECLAFLPSHETGAGSGEFDRNVMYVTGKVTSLEIDNEVATLHGTATVTGLGAGQDLPFTVLVHAGGPGTTVKLNVSGLTFPETLVEGHISVY
ncbi:MAG: hypothetical protein DMG76_31685 [Acidobacteria bacterium]|nr:MAG: hypothetical protein DMG76_31685 [Acidobacteriota bacterium]